MNNIGMKLSIIGIVLCTISLGLQCYRYYEKNRTMTPNEQIAEQLELIKKTDEEARKTLEEACNRWVELKIKKDPSFKPGDLCILDVPKDEND